MDMFSRLYTLNYYTISLDILETQERKHKIFSLYTNFIIQM